MQEEVNDVQVQVNGGQDVFLRGQLVHQKVGVIDDEATEQQSSCTSKYQLHCVVLEEELGGGEEEDGERRLRLNAG